jgi:hypothetical protein
MQDRLERFMARLYTDGGFRKAFVADPMAVGVREGLSAEQCRAVAAMPLDHLHRAARSYEHKRGGAKERPVSFMRRLFGG